MIILNFNHNNFVMMYLYEIGSTNLLQVDELFIDFHTKLQGCAGRHAPIKKLLPKEIKLKSKPWITTEIRKLIKVRNKIFC